MSHDGQALPHRLEEIVADFAFVEGRDKLETLLQFAEELPEVPARFLSQKNDEHQVHECMTPVWVYLEEQRAGLHFHFDVPRESPTVRGFARILQDGLSGCSAVEVAAVPDDFYVAMGLHSVLSMQRLNGIGAILAHIKRLARET